ncbi:MAG: BamA/TamA family outer membrane protein [Bacteroidaceae bacterium]|nr:BamA/TamA family outer membrane protein [Bacteroidaceae bacterium]
MNRLTRFIWTMMAFTSVLLTANAQVTEDKPNVVYGQTRRMPIGGISVEGVPNYEDYLLIGISGLSVGDVIEFPGEDISQAIKRYWKHGLFSTVKIEADKIQNDSIYLKIVLSMRPRVSQVNINGVKKSEKDDLESKMGIIKGNQITPNIIDRAKIVAKKYFDDKGFKNAKIDIVQHDDINNDNQMIVDVNIDKQEKVKVRHIYITGNDHIKRKKFMGGFFGGGLLKKTNEKGFKSFFKTKKFIEEKYAEDKERVIEKYNELGFRDAEIVADSVVDVGDNLVDVYIDISEGQRYYLRDVKWAGNTLYNTDALNDVLQMKPGDVYNQKHINDRLTKDEDAVSNYYYNKGYVFNRVIPVEVDVDGDSVDLEIRIIEGKQASINKIKIYGNDRVYEEVIRRELKIKPGDMFNMEAYKMSYQELGQMGHFDPEQIEFTPQADETSGTVDMNLGLVSKANDQVEFSLGWGITGVIGKIGLKFTNFSMRNLFGKNKNRRGILPQGDAQQLELSASTNGRYYQSYNLSFYDPWFGGKRPNSLSVSAFYSKQTDVSSSYYNSSYYNSYYSMLYGVGNYNNSYYNNYSSYYDPDKYIQLFGASIGWGKRLTWPDNNFSLSATLSYTRYMLKDWEYFLITDGNCNNINLTLRLARSSITSSIFPRSGSQISLSVTATPPYSLWDNKDYKFLSSHTSAADADRMKNLQEMYRWIEYHKWKLQTKFYTPLSSAQKCFVLMTRFDAGFLGSYNKYKKSPFETFYMGGDGMSGYSYNYYSETIGLRGYENGCLTPYGYEGYAYSRLGLELRYPVLLQGSTNIYALGFLEGGNAWTDIKKFNPFDMKRSAGVGVRIFLPMVGMMGIDWAYGFDKVFGSKKYAGSQFHFVLGQEF